MRRTSLLIASLSIVGLLVWLLCFAQKSAATPALADKWHEQVYGLDEGEVLRLIVPPYPPGRNVALFNQFSAPVPPGIKSQLVLHKVNGVIMSYTMAVGPTTIDTDIRWCAGVRPPRMEMVGAVKSRMVSGDWFVKSEESVERRMAALQSIFRSYTRKEIVLEQRVVEREVVVVSGSWNFKQLELAPHAKIAGAVALYASEGDLSSSPANGRGGLEALLVILESWVQLMVLDEITGARPRQVEFKWFYSGQPATSEEARLRVLGNLEEQTGLKFARMKRMVPVWFVEERGGSTQAGGG